MALKLYTYANCGTCRKAIKFLAAHGINATAIPIREQPPTSAELKRMLACYGGQVRKLFNTSGQDYKRLGLRDALSSMSDAQALALLATNGNFVKRPFLLTDTGGAVGFDEERWRALLEGKL